jgi:hypothetical protein
MTTVPSSTPVTTPVELTVAMSVFEDDQVPPAVFAVKVVFVPAQKDVVPETDKATTFREKIAFEAQLPAE